MHGHPPYTPKQYYFKIKHLEHFTHLNTTYYNRRSGKATESAGNELIKSHLKMTIRSSCYDCLGIH